MSFSGTTKDQRVCAQMSQTDHIGQKTRQKVSLFYHVISEEQSCCLYRQLWAGRTGREVGRYFLTHSGICGVPLYTGHAISEILLFQNIFVLLPAPTVIQMSFYDLYNLLLLF